MNFFSKLFSSSLCEAIQPREPEQEIIDTSSLTTTQLNLIKTYEQQRPLSLNLAKKATLSLVKNKLDTIKANVVVVLDASGSMSHQYREGKVQQLLEQLVPLAVHFDTNATLDCWAFARNFKILESITLSNLDNYLKNSGLISSGSDIGIGYDNNEPAVIADVIRAHTESGTTLPTYVIFVTDGGIYQSKEIENLIVKASNLGIFWQFVGIGGSSYGVLEHLDNMQNRIVDNCDFFSIPNLNAVSESQLYDLLLTEFPSWISQAKAKNIISI
jgi:hypothetical protein